MDVMEFGYLVIKLLSFHIVFNVHARFGVYAIFVQLVAFVICELHYTYSFIKFRKSITA